MEGRICPDGQWRLAPPAASFVSNLRTGEPVKEVKNQLLNPLAVGVTLSGRLLDIVVPRPKPRYGPAREFSPRSARRPEDVGTHAIDRESVGPSIASGDRLIA